MMTPQDLPEHLAERVCAASGDAREGELVLYWMKGALRAHENPALDVAIAAANALRRPLFVFQGVSERHPWANDRLHTFLLESARDAHRALSARGIAAALYVEREGHRGAPLKALASAAALVITEHVPVAPLRGWTAALAACAPVWAVDAACVVPMTLTRRAPERAFAFRDATAAARAARLLRPWPEAVVERSWRPAALPFAPVEIDAMSDDDIAALVATCDIDHGVGPVRHTPGGAQAAQARWAHFRDHHLRHYARDRDDPLRPHGASRMSAYLHFGCASPLQIAREAAQRDDDGARKYLDELLIWRELAWHFCHHTPDLDSLAALPRWAQETLQRHAADPRPVTFDWEALARARTGDPLWDTAQRSLLRHGELHNNARMTWGKALLGWTHDPEEALRLLLDLNHRYALDGRDPASYGGLLWCLGLFDRPFSPTQPVSGALRARPTADHARRLEVARWRRLIDRPSMGDPPEVAVIGAGVAGLACARALEDHGLRVTVFDKGRGVGGRASTRRDDAGPFDHGAQFLRARDPHFARHVAAWEARGLLARWPEADDDDTPTLTPAPGMSALPRHLAADLRELRLSTRVGALRRDGLRWALEDDQGAALGSFSRVIVAIPAPQAAALLAAPAPSLSREAALAAYDPCWALMARLDSPSPAPFDLARPTGSPLAWVARERSKPGRAGDERWIAHATPAWSLANLERDPDEVAPLLLEALAALLGADAARARTAAHRWRYALVTQALGRPCLYDPTLGLGACGDWCLGPRLEAAWRSGVAAAGRVLGHTARPLSQAAPAHLL